MNEAIQSFNSVINSYRSSPLASASMLELGLLYADQGKYIEAANTFDKLEQQFAGTESAMRASYEKAVAYHAAKEVAKAEAQFRLVAEKHKGSLYGDKGMIGIGIIRQQREQYGDAIAAFTEVAGRRTDEVGAEAQYRIGETLFKQQLYKDAVTALLRVKYVYPSSRDYIARAYLKIGECYEKVSDKGKAREAYQTVLKTHKEDEFGREADKKMKELQ
ncbi:MAG: tetratricopeptide repeat protein [Ignavibacteriae bacterium]|nr:tetratricopeptide repeat protein [Ignavibacteriota bacterium]